MVMSVCLIQVSPNKSKAFIFLTKVFKLLLIPLSNLSQISFKSPSDKQNIALHFLVSSSDGARFRFRPAIQRSCGCDAHYLVGWDLS